MAFTRGIVMVGDVAWAVNGMAEPDLISLEGVRGSSACRWKRDTHSWVKANPELSE